MSVAETKSVPMVAPGLASRIHDYYLLTKPRVLLVIVLTTAVGFLVGSGPVMNLTRLFLTLLGTGLAAGGGLALNQLMERDDDALMERTKNRPLPAGRLTPEEALVFGVSLVTVGLALLSLTVDPVAGLATALTVGLYLFAYTPLKKRSPVQTLVGCVPGALPPVIGWSAATGQLGPGAWAFFGLFFFWQLPHSLAIGRLYRDEYAAAGIQVLPVADWDGPSTARHIVLNSLALIAAGLLPTLAGIAGALYAGVSLVLGVGSLYLGIQFWRDPSRNSARRVFLGSLLYVPILLVALAVDRIPL